MKAVWCTDIHLNFCDKLKRESFYKELKDTKADVILITGDIGEAKNYEKYIDEIKDYTNMSVVFVLGNHDYYGSSIKEGQDHLVGYSYFNSHFALSTGDAYLQDNVLIIGADFLADMQLGNWKTTTVMLNDENYIAEFRAASKREKVLTKRMYGNTTTNTEKRKERTKYAKADAKQLYATVKKYLTDEIDTVIVLGHAPPYEELSRYQAMKSSPDFIPYYTCNEYGKLLNRLVKRYPKIKFISLSGHTHDYAEVQKYSNLMCYCGKSEYYKPQISNVFEL